MVLLFKTIVLTTWSLIVHDVAFNEKYKSIETSCVSLIYFHKTRLFALVAGCFSHRCLFSCYTVIIVLVWTQSWTCLVSLTSCTWKRTPTSTAWYPNRSWRTSTMALTSTVSRNEYDSSNCTSIWNESNKFFCFKISIYASHEKKGSDPTQPHDKSPYTDRKIQKATWQHKNATKNFDYTTIADRLRTVSWGTGSDSHPRLLQLPLCFKRNGQIFVVTRYMYKR